MIAKHRRNVAPWHNDHPSLAMPTRNLPAYRPRHRAPGEADTQITEWVHVWDEMQCSVPPPHGEAVCGHGTRAVEVYR